MYAGGWGHAIGLGAIEPDSTFGNLTRRIVGILSRMNVG
jgi:hypothetical protein